MNCVGSDDLSEVCNLVPSGRPLPSVAACRRSLAPKRSLFPSVAAGCNLQGRVTIKFGGVIAGVEVSA